MSIDQKTTYAKWESEKYKTRIQRRIGWAGPHYFQCRIKVKQLGGLYYRTVIKETFSRENYATCIITYPFHKDSVVVDLCHKTTFTKK